MDKSGVMQSLEELKERAQNMLKNRGYLHRPILPLCPIVLFCMRTGILPGQYVGCLLRGSVLLFTWGRQKLREETWHRAVGIWLICLEIH